MWMLQNVAASPASIASELKSPLPGTKDSKRTDGWDTEEWGSLEEDLVFSHSKQNSWSMLQSVAQTLTPRWHKFVCSLTVQCNAMQLSWWVHAHSIECLNAASFRSLYSIYHLKWIAYLSFTCLVLQKAVMCSRLLEYNKCLACCMAILPCTLCSLHSQW
jgi:hypothetical protein